MKSIYSILLGLMLAPNLWAQSIECAGADMILVSGQQCCSGLKLNSTTNSCVDASPVDPSLKSCTSHAQCGTEGLGCYPQRFEDLFIEDDAGEDEVGVLDEEPKDNGSACVRNSDCESYNCASSQVAGRTVYQCKEKLVCRLADEGEVAPEPVKCEPELVKNSSSSICELDPNAQNDAYLTFNNPIEVSSMSSANKCELNISDKTKEEALAAITSARSLEFLFAETPETGNDCLKVTNYFQKYLRPLIAERKMVLNYFNEVYKKLDQEAEAIMKADKDSKGELSIDGTTISEREVALRKATGLDMLDIMRRKNLLYKEYEKKMREILQKYAMVIGKLSTDFENFPHHRKKEWTIDGVTYKGKNETCRGGGFLGLGRRRIYKRWAGAVKITKDSAIPTEGVLKNLNIVTQDSPESISKKLGSKKGSGWRIAGGIVTTGLSEVIFRIFGSSPHFMDSPKFISSDSSETRNNFKNKIIAFNKTMIGDESNKNFVFEPELADTTSQSCIKNSSYQTSAECKKFRDYIEDMADVSYAHNVAYTYNKSKKYKRFFPNKDTWRNKLLKHYEVSLTFLTRDSSSGVGPGYYEILERVRDQRDQCYRDLIDGTISNYNGTNSLLEGNNYYQGSATTGGSHTQTSNPTRNLSYADRGKYEFNMSNLTASALKTYGKNDKSFNDASAGSGKIDQAAAINAMNQRIKHMQQVNAKAAAKGVDIVAKERELNNQIAAYGGKKTSGSSGSQGSAGSSNPFGNVSNSGSQNSSDSTTSTTDDMNKKTATGINPNAANSNGAPSSAGAGGSLDGQGFGSRVDSYGNNSSSLDSSHKDPTGMSDEEKNVVMANYERNRSQYETKEEDGLFKVISKAYVRSLDKVLTKKKKIEE